MFPVLVIELTKQLTFFIALPSMQLKDLGHNDGEKGDGSGPSYVKLDQIARYSAS